MILCHLRPGACVAVVYVTYLLPGNWYSNAYDVFEVYVMTEHYQDESLLEALLSPPAMGRYSRSVSFKSSCSLELGLV